MKKIRGERTVARSSDPGTVKRGKPRVESLGEFRALSDGCRGMFFRSLTEFFSSDASFSPLSCETVRWQ